ncbi:MAG TPA: ABC transporter permease [Acidimicrobiales bacterium]|nr:ABC transporter permease [Acidimicrobiales bacterium]
MRDFINFGFSGLTTAAIYAIAATGLVLTYTTTGVFNFAHGAMGMFAAFTYWEMRFGWHWPAPVALVVCLLVLAPLFGAILELGIMRRLQGTSDVTKLVVTISVLLGLFGLANWVWSPSKDRPSRTFFQGRVVKIIGVRLSYHEVTVLLVALAVAIGLRLLLYRTRIGVSMRACVDDPSLATLNGARPARIAMLSWAIGVGLAALAGVLIAPTLQLSQLSLTLLIIDAYAAAIIGRLRSLPMTFVGALILGLANDYALGYITRLHTAEQYFQIFIPSIPVIVLFIALLFLPQARLRGARLQRTREIAALPTWGGSLWFCAAVIAGTVVVATSVSNTDLVNLQRIWGLAIIGLSLIPLIGLGGQISLCQVTFAAIGMVVVAHVGGHTPLAYLWAALITGAIGGLIALPALRLQGIYLALSTAAFAVLMDRSFFQLPKFTIFGHRFDLFQAGSLTVNRPRLFGKGVEGFEAYFIFGAVVFCAMALIVVGIRRSRFGQRLLAMKDSAAAVATLGLNTTVTKLVVFSLSAAMAGVGGAVYGGALRAVDGQIVDFFSGLVIVMLMVIAGLNSVGAALFAGFFLGVPVIQNVFPSLHQLQTVLVGFAGIGLGQNPNGFIAQSIRPQWDVLRKEKQVIVALLALVALMWGLRLGHVIDNWTFVGVILGLAVIAPPLTTLIHSRRSPAPAAEAAAKPVAVPLEWVGITVPYQPEDVERMDRALDLRLVEALPPGAGADGAA